jgi:protein-ribulosamine 3-kinase
MQPDPALLRALSLSSADGISLYPHGGSNFTNSYSLSCPSGKYFVKTSTAPIAASMFLGEFTSLQNISRVAPELSSIPIAHGALENGGHFLITSFLDLPTGKGDAKQLAEGLWKMHNAELPDEVQGKGYGFGVPTCCGDTELDNTWASSWQEFLVERRMKPIARACKDPELEKMVDELCDKVIPKLLEGRKSKPALIHGDLWSGNTSGGKVFDPASFYADTEFETGIMELFGGFGEVLGEYWKLVDEGADWVQGEKERRKDRVKCYSLWHTLNHVRIFGGSYRTGAVEAMAELKRKYNDVE